jgi:hypothetical protein
MRFGVLGSTYNSYRLFISNRTSIILSANCMLRPLRFLLSECYPKQLS